MTEQELRSLVVTTAEAFAGYREADGSHRDIVDIYNSHHPLPRGYTLQYSDDWCAAFVAAVGIRCGITDILPPECSCPVMIRLYQARGRWEEGDDYRPAPGDLIFYDWQDSGAGDNRGTADHVGIVTLVQGEQLRVIEGNVADAVAYRTLGVNTRYIRGYGLPDYAAGMEPGPSQPVVGSPAPAAPLPTEELVRQVIRGQWGNGQQRRQRLQAAGYDPDRVQQAVNAALRGTSALPITPPAAPPAAGDVTLRLPVLAQNSAGESVRALQLLLIGRGYPVGPAGADGQFGPDTGAAVAALRAGRGLSPGSTADEAVWRALLT